MAVEMLLCAHDARKHTHTRRDAFATHLSS